MKTDESAIGMDLYPDLEQVHYLSAASTWVLGPAPLTLLALRGGSTYFTPLMGLLRHFNAVVWASLSCHSVIILHVSRRVVGRLTLSKMPYVHRLPNSSRRPPQDSVPWQTISAQIRPWKQPAVCGIERPVKTWCWLKPEQRTQTVQPRRIPYQAIPLFAYVYYE